MSGVRWTAEAEDLKPAGAPGAMEGGTPRATLHVTVSKPGSFDGIVGVLQRAKSEPHYLYDPASDRLGQFFPLDVSARALMNDGTRRTNGHGSVNIQIEVCAMPTPGFTEGWTPGPNWRAMLRDIRSWGVPDVWPAGRLAATSGDAVDRSWASYSKAGWFGHCNVPGNDHWDPGPIDQLAIFATEDDMTPDQAKQLGEIAGNAYGAHLHAKKATAAADAAKASADAATAAVQVLAKALGPEVQKAVQAALATEYDAQVVLTPKEGV